MSKKAVVLVIDGFGVGEMEDVRRNRRQDHGANTLKNILSLYPTLTLPILEKIGAIDYFLKDKFSPRSYKAWEVSLGKCKLAHLGADSYIGHQEIVGTKPRVPIRQFVRNEKPEIMKKLRAEGFKAEFKNKIILVNENIAIADNIETDYGLNINVVGSLDHFDFKTIEQIGRLVREIVKVGRVITMGGVNIRQSDFFRCLEVKTRDGYTAWGINIPKLQIYNDKYQVIHMGYGVEPNKQITQILSKEGYPVVLIGKTADVIVAKAAIYLPQVYSQNILSLLIKQIREIRKGLIFVNIQETDLAGHSQDSQKYRQLLELIDKYIPQILKELAKEDIFIITGDHGNDPTIGHTNHTREKTPFILFSQTTKANNLGERKTLADVGATLAEFFQVKKPESGQTINLVG